MATCPEAFPKQMDGTRTRHAPGNSYQILDDYFSGRNTQLPDNIHHMDPKVLELHPGWNPIGFNRLWYYSDYKAQVQENRNYAHLDQPGLDFSNIAWLP